MKVGQHLSHFSLSDPKNLAASAVIQSSSELVLAELPEANMLKPLIFSVAQLLPIESGPVPQFIISAES